MQPGFQSLALQDLPHPDFADVAIVAVSPALGARLAADPAAAARAIFDLRNIPLPVKALFGLRQLFVTLLRIPSGPSDRHAFRIRQVVGNEAYIATDQPHLDFRVGVAVEDDLLRLTTAVRLKGWRGRAYFLPVQVVHPVVTRMMMLAAVRRLSVPEVAQTT